MLDTSKWRGHKYSRREINNIDVTKAVSFVHITFIHSFIHYASECKKFRPKLCNDEEMSCSLTQVAAHACWRQKKAPTSSGHPPRHRTQHSSHTLRITLSQPQQLYLLSYLSSPLVPLKTPKNHYILLTITINPPFPELLRRPLTIHTHDTPRNDAHSTTRPPAPDLHTTAPTALQLYTAKNVT